MVDHYMIYAVRKVNASRLKRSSPKTIEFRSLRNYCKEDFFIKDLQRINWVSILEPMSDSPNEMASVFIDIFEKLLKVHAPLKKRRLGVSTRRGLPLILKRAWKNVTK